MSSASILRRFLARAQAVTLVAAAILLTLFQAVAADEITELTIPLKNGRFYSLKDLCAQCNEHLGSHYDLAAVPSGLVELTPQERVLLLASGAIELTSDRITLRVPPGQRPPKESQGAAGVLRALLPDEPPASLPLPKSFDPNARTILFIPGLDSNAAAFESFQSSCHLHSVQSLVYDYPSRHGVADGGKQLSEKLKELTRRYPDLRLTIVGHSMGGLVARYCLETPGLDPGCVHELFLLGTPNQGSALAAEAEWIEVFKLIAAPHRAWWEVFKPGLGLGVPAGDLLPDSAVLRELATRERNPAVRYHIAAGTKSFLAADKCQAMRAELERRFAQWGTPTAERDRILKLLDDEALRDGVGDGVVSVESTRLPEVVDHQTFALNHLELLALRGERPEEHGLFRWIVDERGTQAKEH